MTDESHNERPVTMEKIVALCKRRGFIFASSDIYGGLAATYDYGHYGVALKNNVKAQWWRRTVKLRPDVLGLDAAILMHPRTWEASGHVGSFSDPLVQCLGKCGRRHREDHLRAAQPTGTLLCPDCGGPLSAPMDFNLMFKTVLGPVAETGTELYLRPETAQGIFVNFENVLNFSRVKLPFGIAQMGKSFRNEITTRNFIFRTCEFEQMELEWFCSPEDADHWYEYWRSERLAFYTDLGIRPQMLRLRDHDPSELAFYSRATADVEYRFPMDWQELEGVANRTDYDLSQHAKFSGHKLTYRDPNSPDKLTRAGFTPYVIEPSAGADRATLAFLVDAYDEDELGPERRVLLRLHPKLAPVKCAVLPLVRKDGQPEFAQRLHAELQEALDGDTELDIPGHIGKRYRRQDEIGTPWAVTVDHQTLEDGTVTVRDRDTLQQERIASDQLADVLASRLRHS